MGDHAADDGGDRLPIEAEPANSRSSLVAEIVVAGGRPATCTIFPPGATGLERASTWLSADEGSFVSLEAVR